MIPLLRLDGTPATDAELRALQHTPHGVECVAEARTETDARNTWRRLAVTEAQVSLFQPGEPMELDLTLVAPVTLQWHPHDGGLEPAVVTGFDTERQPEVTPWGTWIRVAQHIRTPGADKNPIVVPWGYFMVTEVTTVNNTWKVIAKDALEVLNLNPVLSIRDSRLVHRGVHTGDDIASRIVTLIEHSWPLGMHPWAFPVGDVNKPNIEWPAGRNLVGHTPTPATTQYSLDRMETVLAMCKDLGLDLFASRTPDAIYRLKPRHNPATFTPNVRDIRARDGSGLVELREVKTREGVVNRAVVLWTEEVKDNAGTVIRSREMRTRVDLVNDPGGEAGKVYLGQRFGTQSAYVNIGDTADRAASEKKAMEGIEFGLAEATTWEVDVSPVYGLEIGDMVGVADAYGNTGRGWTREMRVGLTQSGRWTLTLIPSNLIDAKSFGKPVFDELAFFKNWRSVTTKAVDMDFKTTRGWSATGATLSKTKTGVRAKATASTFTVQSVAEFPANQFGAAKCEFQVGKVPERVKVTAGLDGKWGTALTLARNTSKTVPSGHMDVAGSTKFMVQIRFENVTPGSIFDLNGVTCEIPA